MAKVRRPTQAGTFYQGNTESLRRQIENCFLHEFGPGKIPKVTKAGPRQVIGLVCPHAGYMFSGPVAAHAYYKLAVDGKPNVVVILGPNHMGYGSALAVMTEGLWRTPLGDVEVDGEIANRIVHESRIVDVDETAHRFEHSIEVQLPFLQYLFGSQFRIVPLCFLMQDLSSAKEVGQAVAKVLAGKDAVIIASSDMTHYEPQESAARKDRLALEAVEAMDEAKFFLTVEEHQISACGYGPIATLVSAAKFLNAKEAKLLCYKTSGNITGDYSSVVGYAAVCFTK
ncbi:MAG: AmmeMemoRadiSam system protein B [Candidatus Bathyarchaeota archaeon]|nr:AmmeMemoRadiSam system protein B [Candidatus Bathyarchaeota archaeon]MDH5786692.1 AmmeMemoRadiSam system protein B [Candidatus Bathyarchaeota archaeon]